MEERNLDRPVQIAHAKKSTGRVRQSEFRSLADHRNDSRKVTLGERTPMRECGARGKAKAGPPSMLSVRLGSGHCKKM